MGTRKIDPMIDLSTVPNRKITKPQNLAEKHDREKAAKKKKEAKKK